MFGPGERLSWLGWLWHKCSNGYYRLWYLCVKIKWLIFGEPDFDDD